MTDPDASESALQQAESEEELKERLERELNELLQELRSLIPGAEVLFGFLLAISFTVEFRQLGNVERYVYYATLLFTGLALVLYLAPAAHHRLRFRGGDKDYLLRKANREVILGTVASSLALTGVIFLVSERVFGVTEAVLASVGFFAFTAWRWWSLALLRAYRD